MANKQYVLSGGKGKHGNHSKGIQGYWDQAKKNYRIQTLDECYIDVCHNLHRLKFDKLPLIIKQTLRFWWSTKGEE